MIIVGTLRNGSAKALVQPKSGIVGANQFQRDLLFERAIIAFAMKDIAHATAADLAQHPERPELRRLRPGERRIQIAHIETFEQCRDTARQFHITQSQCGQLALANLGVEIRQAVEFAAHRGKSGRVAVEFWTHAGIRTRKAIAT